eukprot:CAMPEP_0185902892 /NCGR_PEP_ID=MMETSP0196C-20130402/2107_1 /TAXON_ID=2932 /ORGANISM="Alexandrium fundyense, Strain CCMP1719" /LENGTH=88 /DNA_ID=CAMNT_0028621823 /DNA_START=1 /DNA_END=267 /DNA_ORIENTATION=+
MGGARCEGLPARARWGMVANPAPKDIFKVNTTSNTTIGELKAVIAKDNGYSANSQKLLYFGAELENERTLESCGWNNTDDPLLHMIPA